MNEYSHNQYHCSIYPITKQFGALKHKIIPRKYFTKNKTNETTYYSRSETLYGQTLLASVQFPEYKENIFIKIDHNDTNALPMI